MREKILVVDDEQEIADLVALYLQGESFEVFSFYSAAEALECIRRESLDLAILDVMMPEMDGFQLCRIIREQYTYPVIMLTAKGEEIDKITGLTLGADDYITKPFSPSELVARVKGHIQRYQRLVGSREKPRPEILKVRGLEIDRESRRVWVNGKEVNMTSKEYDLLLFLAEHPDTVFSKDRLFDHVWGMDAYGDVSTITVHIKHIRDKIELNPDRTQYIETVWGVGYKFEVKK